MGGGLLLVKYTDRWQTLISMHVLFVCWGNICRSPAAECTFRKLLDERGLGDKFTCDSAGTIGSHQGNPPDSRMRQAAQGRDLTITGAAWMIRIRTTTKPT